MLDRRKFLGSAAGVSAAALFGSTLLERIAAAPRDLPSRELLQANEDSYWAEIRKQFLIPADEVYLNNGTVGSSPARVLKAVFDGYNQTEKMEDTDPEDYPIWGYGPWNEFRDPLAAFVGATRDEIALVRNATEANNYIANGIDMKPGDEVLTTDQEHGSGNSPWELKAKRYGIVIKRITLPRPVPNPAAVLNLFSDAITPKTRVIFFSHITTDTGVVLPAKEICALARSKGLISAVDGAQVIGMMRLNISDIGCDFYTSSPHKWLMAPKGTGFLFVKKDMIDRVWSTVVTGGWDDPKMTTAERFQHFGSSNVPSLWGLRAAIQMSSDIGMEKIETRHRKMADYIHAEMMKRGAVTVTSPNASMRCAIATVTVAPIDRLELEHWMWSNHKIRIRGSQPSKLRLCTPYYLQKAEIDRFLTKFDDYKREKKLA